jgi:acetyl esterase
MLTSSRFLGGNMVTPLDPVIAQVLTILPQVDPGVSTPQSARDLLRSISDRATVPPPVVEIVFDTKVAGAAGALPARVYRMSRERSPTIVFFHGGGWVAGDLETHDRTVRWLAIETGAVVVSVDYRRAPEASFPGPFEDCFAAVRDVLSRIDEFGGDNRRLGVAGDSAGGNLAAAVAIACRDAGIKLAAQLLIYPAVDLSGSYVDPALSARYPSRAENADGYFLTSAATEWFRLQYLGDPTRGADWRASPLKAKNLAGLPPAVVCTAWFDPLRDEGDAYGKALQAAGVPTKRHSGLGLIHGYFGMAGVSETVRAEAQRACADFKSMLEGAG